LLCARSIRFSAMHRFAVLELLLEKAIGKLRFAWESAEK